MSDLTAYDVQLTVNRVLSENEKNQLVLAVSDAIEQVLGPVKGGTMLIYSEPTKEEV